MVTEEQVREVVVSMRNAWSGYTPREVQTLLDWARQELARRTPPDDGPMTAEEADRAYDEAESVSISDEEVEALLQHVRDRSDGPITAEWCREHGARHWAAGDEYVFDCGVRWSVPLGEGDVLRGGVYLDHDHERGIRNVRPLPSVRTRSQLLALLAALRGEPSGQTGQLQPLSQAEQLHVSRGQLNNLGGGR